MYKNIIYLICAWIQLQNYLKYLLYINKNYKQIYTLKNISYIIYCFEFTITKNNNYCRKIQKIKINQIVSFILCRNALIV